MGELCSDAVVRKDECQTDEHRVIKSRPRGREER